MNFIELTEMGKKTLINLDHVIQFIQFEDKTRILMSDDDTMIDVAELYDEIKNIIAKNTQK